MFQDRKYFLFRFYVSGVLVMAFLMISPAQAVSEPKECAEVAIYAKNKLAESNTIDLTFLRNFIGCIKELYGLYKTTDWKTLQGMIPQGVRDVMRNVPKLRKKALAVAKREGLCFVSVYLLYRTVDLYDQAMSLDMDYKMYRKEFEWLRMELEPVIYLIHTELLPQWEYLGSTALRKITSEVIVKLSRYHAELKQLIRDIHKGISKGLSGRRWAAAYALGSTASFLGSIAVGNVLGAIVSYASGLMSLANFGSLTSTIEKLAYLQYHVEMMCRDTEEYRALLEHKLIHGALLERFDVIILLSVILLFLLLRRRDEHGRD